MQLSLHPNAVGCQKKLNILFNLTPCNFVNCFPLQSRTRMIYYGSWLIFTAGAAAFGK